jgi:biopolymer transport protein ExbB/TolQ
MRQAPGDAQAATEEQTASDESTAAAQAAAAALAASQAASQAAADGKQTAKGGGKRPPRSNSTIETILPFTSGLVLSVLLQIFIANSVDPNTYIYRLFRPPGGWVMALVPGLIVFVLVWTLVDLALKYRTGMANEADLDRREVRQLPRLVAQEPVGTLQRRLLALAGRDRPVARRLLWLLHYLESNADAQRTHELLRHQADLDADTAAAGYRTVKLFIWAMPILGFVGTVLGISLAVGGFSQFLTTNLDIEDVSRVTSELGNVASGLSFAFDTTLLGLLAGLLANVVSSGVQKKDEHFFTRLDELGLSIVANRQGVLMNSDQARSGAMVETGPEFEREMRARIQELGSLITRTQELMSGLGETSARMNSGLGDSMSSVRRTVEELGGNLEGVSEALAGSMAEISVRVTTSQDRYTQSLSGLRDAIDRTQQQTASGAESQATVEQAVRDLSASVAQLGEMLSDFRTEQNALAPVLQQLAGPLELKLVPRGPRTEPQA